MPIKALKRMAPFWYTPKDEHDVDGKPVPNATKFKIRGLDGVQQGYVMPELTVDQALRMATGMTGKGLELTLNYGLLDWENFTDDDGPIAFSALNFNRIDIRTRTELAMEILTAGIVSPEEKKT